MSRKELELDTCLAYQLINKWGPCTRTIISLMCVPPKYRASEEEDLEHAARKVSDDICANPSAVSDPIGSGMADSAEPGIFFVRPLRQRGASGHCGHINFSRAVAHIPTPHLLAIFKRSLQWIESEAALRLFRALSSPHAFTLPAADWRLEIRMHAYLCSGSLPLPLFRAPDMESSMQPSQSHQSLWGSINALDNAGRLRVSIGFRPKEMYRGSTVSLVMVPMCMRCRLREGARTGALRAGCGRSGIISTGRFGTSMPGTSSSFRTRRSWRRST